MDCLFVIDYQRDSVDGVPGFPGAEKPDAAIPRVRRCNAGTPARSSRWTPA
jgi:nicotinamidase-related amidase